MLLLHDMLQGGGDVVYTCLGCFRMQRVDFCVAIVMARVLLMRGIVAGLLRGADQAWSFKRVPVFG